MAVIRQNSFDGADEVAVTTTNSADHGDGFDHVDSTGVTYDTDDAYEGTASLRLDDASSSNGVAWQGLSLTDCAMRVYVKRSADAESGNVWWTDGGGSAALGTGGDLGFGDVSLDDALPADTWCRVEAVRDGTTVTLSVWSTDPESPGAPDATGTGTISGDTITQWWLEHMGDPVWYDQLALADTADMVGPINPTVTTLTNSTDGAEGEAVTVAESADHGDAWGLVDSGIYYTATAYKGGGALGLPGGGSAKGVAWNTGISLTDFCARGYLYWPDSSGAGNACWANGVGAARITEGGGLTWAGLALADGTIPPDTWCRIEFSRSGDTGTLSVWSADPQSTGSADATTSGTVTEDTVVQWWWERSGTGPIVWDELALADTADSVGPVAGGNSGEDLLLAPGLPMFA